MQLARPLWYKWHHPQPRQIRYAQNKVEFAGFEITTDTARPCKKYIRAILEFPTQQSLTDARSCFGLIHLVSYAFSMTNTLLPFRELLKPSNKFHWYEDLQQAYDKSKLTISEEIQNGVKIFDKTKPICLVTDWLNHYIGYWLFQKYCSCHLLTYFVVHKEGKITLVRSRFTHSAKSWYASLEGEAIAVTDGLDKARLFVLRCKT